MTENDSSKKGTVLSLIAPLSGVLMPIEKVPDPVFSQKLVGDGISIDPTSSDLIAPCDGKIIQIHSAGHALTISTPGGLEIMMHIGLDTVHLKGRGFKGNVKMGDSVKTGDLLITFDPEYLATNAKSLLTQIVITNSDKVAEMKPCTGIVVAGKNEILQITLGGICTTQKTEEASQTIVSEAIVILNPSGLHARPAASLVSLSKRFKSDIHLRRGKGMANAKSVVSILALDVKSGDKIFLEAAGCDAKCALETIVPKLREGLGEELTPHSQPVRSEKEDKKTSGDPNVLKGVSASQGLAVGRIFQLKRCEISFQEEGEDISVEKRRLTEALEIGKSQLAALQDNFSGSLDPGKAEIFSAHREMLEDPDLLEISESLISKGKSAEFAWKNAFSSHAERLSAMTNELLAARATDLKDVGNRVLQVLSGKSEKPLEFPDQCILIAEDLTPSDTVNLDRKKVLGFCTVAGGATSHVAILARSLALPALAAIEPRALELKDGTLCILDGGKATLRINPDPGEVDSILKRKEIMAGRRGEELQHSAEPALSRDSVPIEVFANIGGISEAEEAVKLGGEGVGLLRSEFLFLDRAVPPDEEEQTRIYSSIARALGKERPLIIRTLDVGGDKPLAYLPIPKEENPFLGERGIRIGLNRPELLRTQIRAILRASLEGKVLVMFPMIAMLSEWRQANGILLEEADKLKIKPIPAGIMVEVPAAALMSDLFARETAFFSIGTNDLTQYTLAMDRGHPKLAAKVDALNPSVLRLIAQTVESARKFGKKVGVCGGIAGDPGAVAVLLGLGVTELSVSVPVIPSIKALIRRLDLQECRILAQKALSLESSEEVRNLYKEEI
ncbi:MAG: phosphoenolpyruvate--protein phosphotransferase [Candidatus Riflebacteria bacterium]|nr:phosphoenolpyruvate--protein phosphotransferase [Candidatus Riflebacteria bacterium]